MTDSVKFATISIFTQLSLVSKFICITLALGDLLRESTFFLGGRGLGPQSGGTSVTVSTKMGGSYLFVSYSRGGSHTFSRFLLMRIFVTLLSNFLTD